MCSGQQSGFLLFLYRLFSVSLLDSFTSFVSFTTLFISHLYLSDNLFPSYVCPEHIQKKESICMYTKSPQSNSICRNQDLNILWASQQYFSFYYFLLENLFYLFIMFHFYSFSHNPLEEENFPSRFDPAQDWDWARATKPLSYSHGQRHYSSVMSLGVNSNSIHIQNMVRT